MICLLVRDFATTQERRLNPSLTHAPLILIEAGTYRPKVIAPDAEARQKGVKAGMWFGEAQSLCPDAEFLTVEETRYQRLFMDMTSTLLAITDRIEPEYQATSAVWYCDDRLILSHLVEEIEKTTGIKPQIGIAVCKFPARVAAASTQADTCCELAAGDEVAFLQAYPVSLLPLSKLMHRRLPLLGIDTLGQLSALPRIAIWEQFGQHGRWCHDLASGKDVRPLASFKAPVSFSQQIELDDPLSDRQMLYHMLEQLSLNLIEGLAGQEAEQVTLIVKLSNGQVLDDYRHPTQTVRDHLYLLRLLTAMLDRLHLDTSVSGIEARLTSIKERLPVQLSLFETKKAVMSLQVVAPEWAMRHRQADFYQFHRSEIAYLPEDKIERHYVSGA